MTSHLDAVRAIAKQTQEANAAEHEAANLLPSGVTPAPEEPQDDLPVTTVPVEPPVLKRSDIDDMNDHHAMLPIASKTRVVTLGEDEEFPGRQTIILTQTPDDFALLKNKYRHEYQDEDGKWHSVGKGTYWLRHKERRQYDFGMAFMPYTDEKVVRGRLNLWQGYGVRPRKPEGKSGAAGCFKFLDLMREVICGGNDEHFDYLLKREAFILQKRQRSEIALALRTKEEGAGKGQYEKHMGHLLGRHAMQVSNPAHVIGKFNPHLETLLRLHADEALFVGNHEHRNALFGQITESKLVIEHKFAGVYTVNNYLNTSISSNSDHFIPVSGTARRFFVPTVSTAHVQDFEYFRAIKDQLSNDGGYEALLYHFLNEVDLRDFNVRAVPKTAGLAEQAAYSRSGVEGLVEQVCNTGRVPNEHWKWSGFTITTGYEKGEGFAHFIQTNRDKSLANLGSIAVTKRLCKEWGCTAERKREPGSNDRTQGFQWPMLAELRGRFETRFGKQAWLHSDVSEFTAGNGAVDDGQGGLM
jgi:hypothetical protein